MGALLFFGGLYLMFNGHPWIGLFMVLGSGSCDKETTK